MFVSFGDPKVSCSSILAHQLRRRFQPWSCPEARSRSSAALLGLTPLRAACSRGSRVSRWKRSTLPAPLTGWSETILRSSPRALPLHHFIACRRRSELPSLPHPSCRCRRSGEAGTSVPITHSLCAPIRVAPSGKIDSRPVDNGDIADRIGTSARLPFRSRRPTSHSCPNPLP